MNVPQVLPPHSNQVSALDGQAYDLLTVAQAAINSATASLSSGALPGSAEPTINAAISVYNAARQAWLDYDGAVASAPINVASGTAFTNLTAALAALNGAISSLNKLGATK